MFRTVTLDLFDTVVDLHMERMPEFEIRGRRMRGTQAALHAVLVERAPVSFESFVEALRATDLAKRVPLYEQGREYPTVDRFSDVMERLGIADPELPELLTETHMQQIVDQARYLPHHVALLRDLATRVRIGICSNFSHRPTAVRILEKAGLLPHIHEVVISEEVGVRKPRREIFQEALERLGAVPEQTLHVGDRLGADVRGAAEAGLTPVWITRRVRDPERSLLEHSGPTPAHVIADLEELRAIVGPA